MKLRYSMAFGLPLLSASAAAADFSVKWELPQLNVAEYHRPYSAIWIEKSDQSVVATLAVLYDLKKKENGGTKWLKDLRQWWRKAGHDMQMPMDGVSGATRPAGENAINFDGAKSAVDKLSAGEYQLVMEAARESGGREVVRVPFKWPATSVQTASASGKEELGKVTLQIKP